jgi:hypothetical protein
MKISVEIENCYELFDDVTTRATADVPDFPHGGSDDEIEDWWYDNIFCLSGVGHEEGNSSYFVVVKACDDPALVGATYDWGL